MEKEHNMVNISVIWRGKKLDVKINSGATLKDFGHKLLSLTSVKSDTLRLLIPRSFSNKSKLINPFSDEHSSLSLPESSILEGKSIRMMGVFENEIEEVSQDGKKADLRIAGFDEEEKRLKQRMLYQPQRTVQLPQGPYTFCDFKTLHIPGLMLNPPASEALRRMHMLAADPGIVAIMNKHRWRVGIMTEMAPEGYVGVSPKCLLGFNKNHGEEISLRLRTDDLKGFRKYEVIKKTLLHELAHMVYSEHDANFYALNKQLDQEAATLDWTKSRSYSLSGRRHSDLYEDEEDFVESSSSSISRRLGGNASDRLATARESSVAAAYNRLVFSSYNSSDVHGMRAEPDPDDSGFQVHLEPDPDDSRLEMHAEPDPDDSGFEVHAEPDPDDTLLKGVEAMETETYSVFNEPDPDDSEARHIMLKREVIVEPDPDDSLVIETTEIKFEPKKTAQEPDPDDSITSKAVLVEPDPDDNKERPMEISNPQVEEPDPDDEELRRIQDPVAIVCSRLQKAIQMLKSQVNANDCTSVIQTLFKIIRNVIEHPGDKKFQRLRKANPQFQKNIANYKAAMDVLFLVGFMEDVVSDEIGRLETYLVLKRNDPGLLWLAKSSLETCIV